MKLKLNHAVITSINQPAKRGCEWLVKYGAAYAAGIAAGIFDREKVFSQMTRTKFSPEMEPEVRNEKYQGWKKAVKQVLT